MSVSEGWTLLRQCVELTERIDAYLANPAPSMVELSALDSLYAQRHDMLVCLQQWWDSCAHRSWTSEQAREWIALTQELLHRSTRQQELIRLLLQRAEQQLRAALLQHRVVRYIEGDTHGDRPDTAAPVAEQSG